MHNFDNPNAPLWRRIAAFLYDILLLTAIFFVVTAIVVVIFNSGEHTHHPLYFVLLYAIGLLFFTWCWRRGGQTLGMQAWRIMLVNDKLGPITKTQCLKRYLAGTFCFIFTYLGSIFGRKKLAWHDQFSNTKIIFKSTS